MEGDVEQLAVLDLKRHEIVHLVNSQTDVQPLHHFVPTVEHGYLRVLFFLLHGQQQILVSTLQPNHGMVFAEHLRLYLGRGSRDGQ